MAGNRQSIHAGSGSSLAIDTPDGHYILSREECRHLLSSSRRMVLQHADGTVPGDAVAYLAPGTVGSNKPRVIIETARCAFSVPDRAFVTVSEGKPAAPVVLHSRKVKA